MGTLFKNVSVMSWDIYSDPNADEKNLSHSVLIPNYILDAFLGSTNLNDISNPVLYIEIKDMSGPKDNLIHKCLVFSDVGSTENDVCVLPYWAMAKLQLEQFGKVSIENVNNIRKVGYIRLKANRSDYAFWDNIKQILETELEKYRCISIGDLIAIVDIEFYVIEIRDTDGIRMIDGSLYDTEPSIEFETPTDIEERERIEVENARKIAEHEKEIENAMFEAKQREDENAILEQKKMEQANNPFKGVGRKLNDISNDNITPSRVLTRDEIAAIYKKRLSNAQS